MRGKVGGLSPPYFKSRGAIAPLAPLLPPPLYLTKTWINEHRNLYVFYYENATNYGQSHNIKH